MHMHMSLPHVCQESCLGSLEVFNPLSWAWEVAESMSTPRSGHALVAHGGCLFAVGGTGVDGARLSSIETFCVQSGHWTSAYHLSLLTPRSNFAVALDGSHLYVVGGWISDSEATPTVELHNLETGDALERPSLLASRACHAAAFLGGKLYVSGGKRRGPPFIEGEPFEHHTVGHEQHPLHALSSVECFDPGTGRWQELAPLQTGRASFAMCAVDGALYAVGGISKTGDSLRSVERYDVTRNVWLNVAPMPTPRYMFATAVV